MQHITVLMALIYYSKRIPNKISKGQKVYEVNTRGNQAKDFESPPPRESHRMHLISSARSSDAHLKCCLLSKFF